MKKQHDIATRVMFPAPVVLSTVLVPLMPVLMITDAFARASPSWM